MHDFSKCSKNKNEGSTLKGTSVLTTPPQQVGEEEDRMLGAAGRAGASLKCCPLNLAQLLHGYCNPELTNLGLPTENWHKSSQTQSTAAGSSDLLHTDELPVQTCSWGERTRPTDGFQSSSDGPTPRETQAVLTALSAWGEGDWGERRHDIERWEQAGY